MGHGPDLSAKSYGLERSKVALVNHFWDSGVALIASAAFLFSCTSLAVKLLGKAVPTFQVVCIPGLICFAATSAVVKWNGLSVRSKSWHIAGLTLLRGLLGATSITCFYLAIELLPLQDAVTLFFCSPVVATLLELLVTGESQGWACAAATACTVAGVVLVAQPPCVFSGLHSSHVAGGVDASSPESHSGTSAAGVALATGAAIANAAAFVVVRMMRQSQSTLVLTWWYHGVMMAVSAIPLALGYPDHAVLPNARGWALLVLVGVTQLVGQLLLNRGFQLESATRGSAINVLQVLFSFLWDVTALGDKPGLVSITGSSLVAAGVLFAALTGNRPATADSRLQQRRRYPHADSNSEDEPRSDVEEPLVRPSRDGVADAAAASTAAQSGGGAATAAASGRTSSGGMGLVADSRAPAELWRATLRGQLGGSSGSSGGGGAPAPACSGGGGGDDDGSEAGQLREPLLAQ